MKNAIWNILGIIIFVFYVSVLDVTLWISVPLAALPMVVAVVVLGFLQAKLNNLIRYGEW
ncbi:MAG: hypothetical protein ABJP82_01360 [Hyphomicrobiales bacterium]